jgi:hypothetical protein
MRSNILFISAASALALAGCNAAEPPSLELCPVAQNCGAATPPDTTPPATTPTTPSVTNPDVGTVGVNTTANTGNTTKLQATDATVDTAIALETSQVLVPQDSSKSNLSRLTEAQDANGNFTSAKIEIDTKTQSNSNWPKAKDLPLFHTQSNKFGGAEYREYRLRSSPLATAVIDEELQVWDWGSSRAYQYRHVPGGGEAINQLWGFGGQKTDVAELPTSGSASFTGRFVGAAKTWGWKEGGVPPVAINNLWRVTGTAKINTDFTAQTMSGTLSPTLWNARDREGHFTDVIVPSPGDPN